MGKDNPQYGKALVPHDWPYGSMKRTADQADEWGQGCYDHDPCDESAVLQRMDKDSEWWYYCKKCGAWTAPLVRRKL